MLRALSLMLTLALAVSFAAFPLAPRVAHAEVRSEVAGTYSVHGTNPNGSTYTGTVVVKPEGGRYYFSWLIANGDTYRGTGTRTGNTLVVPFGGKYPVIYEVGADGVLHGKWENGRASETLVPKK